MVSAGDWHQLPAEELACLVPSTACGTGSQGLVTYTFDQGVFPLVFPNNLRRRVAMNLHGSNPNLDNMERRARQAVYWPGMGGYLQHVGDSCDKCKNHATSQAAEPFIGVSISAHGRFIPAQWASVSVLTSAQTGWKLIICPTASNGVRYMAVLLQYFALWGVP